MKKDWIRKRSNHDYQPFGYLAERNHIEMEPCLVPERSWELPITREETDRIAKILSEHLYIGAHEHPNMTVADLDRDLHRYLRDGRDYYGYGALEQCWFDVIFDNMLDGTAMIHSKEGWKWEEVIHDLGMRRADIAHQDLLRVVEGIEDMVRAKEEGRIGIVFSVEGAAPIENEIDRVDILYGLGVRAMGVTYSQSNALGSGLKEDNDGGLTDFGRAVVRRMNEIGMLIDCSHCGVQTALDTIEWSQKPILLSHVGARRLRDSRRLFPDEVLKAVAEKGGVIGVEAAPNTTTTKNYLEHSIDSVMEHFEYIRELVGIDHVTFGFDTLYGDHVGIHRYFDRQFKTDSHVKGEILSSYVRGLENPSEASRNGLKWLVKHGYSDEEIKKVIGGNLLRILRQVW